MQTITHRATSWHTKRPVELDRSNIFTDQSPILLVD
jgi:hypothetical protein